MRWFVAPRLRIACVLALLESACLERREPPGARPDAGAEQAIVAAEADGTSHGPTVPAGAPGKDVLGTADDNLPFAPDGTKAGSIAWRTWIYTDTGNTRTRYGYFRTGEVFDVRGPAIANDGCAGGWYRVNPRGFVCVGKGATLDLKDVVLIASSVRPIRGHGLPYLYARASETPPLFYFKLPSKSDMNTAEGDGVLGYAERWKQRIAANGLRELIGEPGAPPEFLARGREAPKPYGVVQRLHLSVHAGRASMDSGFAIARVFEHERRVFGLTTELDVIALDRTDVVRPSVFHGVELAEGEGLPVAFVKEHYAQRYVLDEHGQAKPEGVFRFREPLKLTGKKQGASWETRDGAWVVGEAARILAPRASFPSFATGDRKWIDISINDQSLVAYVGTRPVYATLVSTGRGGLGDPEKAQATVRGTFMVYQKHVSATMDGEEDKADSFNLQDVPFVQYFHKGYALHGTYWHDEYGKVRSHGCVNLAPEDAAWLFEWTDPNVPLGWHGAVNKDRGTVVYIHA
jgi:lipoprotein-anchoring transpeptidase ErfK/SrfK